MRIVAGKYGSRKLQAPAGDTTRPTLDKVREAVFSSLGGYFDGGRMLDLYGGSGAVSLEGISRGIEEAVIVEKNRRAAAVIRENIKALGVEKQTELLQMSAERALALLAERGQRFDLVYLDPPYKLEQNEKVMTFLEENDLLNENATVVVESLKADEFADVGKLHLYHSAVYGITRISYYRQNI